VPLETWVHLDVVFRFAGLGHATFDLTVTPWDAPSMTFTDLPCTDTSWSQCNWLVTFGGGAQLATFYVDNVQVTPGTEGPASPVFDDDFEATPVGGTVPEGVGLPLIQALARTWSAPLEVQAPQTVRAGYFERDEKVLVHLHNRRGTHADFGRPVGPAATITSRAPVGRAVLALSGKELDVRQEGGAWVVQVPHVGLYEVVELER
jgi:hypothetical protein